MGPLFKNVMLIQDPWCRISSLSIPKGVPPTSYFRSPLLSSSLSPLPALADDLFHRLSPLYVLLPQPQLISASVHIYRSFHSRRKNKGNVLLSKKWSFHLHLSFQMSVERFSLDTLPCTSYFHQRQPIKYVALVTGGFSVPLMPKTEV